MDIKITLQSNDKVEFKVTKKVSQMLPTLDDMVNDLGGYDENTKIEFNSIDSYSLGKVIEYCENHVDNQPVDYLAKGLVLSDFDNTFCPSEHEQLFKITLAANYLCVKPLLDLCSKTIASHIEGKSSEEIRKMWNIKNDFSPEEEALNEKEADWCEEM